MPIRKKNLGTHASSPSPATADAIFDAIATPLVVIDSDLLLVRLNRAAEDLLGSPANELVGQGVSCLSPAVSRDGIRSIETCLSEWIQGETHATFQVDVRRRSGKSFTAQLALARVDASDSATFVGILTDLTEQRRQESDLMHYLRDLESAKAQSESHATRIVELVEELATDKERLQDQQKQLRENEDELLRYVQDLEMTRSQFEKQASEMVWLAEQLHSEKEQVEESRRVIEHQAHHDPLTHLGNRALLTAVLPKMIENARATGTKVGVIYLDLDNFKEVNDRLGHDAGDQLLCTVADALRGSIRDDDEVIRQGGDEFAVVVKLSATRNEKHLRELAERIRAALTISVEGPGFTIQTGASLGIALFPEDGDTIDTILSAADDAMYRDKRAGKGRVV